MSRSVPRPDTDPERTRKKTLRTPRETVKDAMDQYPDGVIHSYGHVTRNAAASAKKRIDARKGQWVEFVNHNLYTWIVTEDNGTFSVAVGIEFKDGAFTKGAL